MIFFLAKELNRSTIDVMCSSEPLMFPLPRGFIAVELRSITCYIWSEYAEYLQNNYKVLTVIVTILAILTKLISTNLNLKSLNIKKTQLYV
jgi:hypothetical protein